MLSAAYCDPVTKVPFTNTYCYHFVYLIKKMPGPKVILLSGFHCT